MAAFLARAAPSSGESIWAGACAALAVASAAAAVAGLPLLAVALAVSPVLMLGLQAPGVPAAVGVGLLPLLYAVVEVPGLRLAMTDFLFLIASVALVVNRLVRGQRILRLPLALRALLVFYLGVVLLSVVIHAGRVPLLGAVQRVELVMLPLLVAAALSYRLAVRAMTGYVLVCVAVAAAQIAAGPDHPGVLGLQKNSVGQFLAVALLLVLFAPGLPRAGRALAPVLGLGLAFSQSRGSLVGLVVGLCVVASALPGATSVKLRRLLLLLVALAFVVAFVPQGVTSQITDFSADQTPTGDNVAVRLSFRDDAEAIILANPLTGVGINRYRSGSATDGTLTDDPHNVVLLEAAELGIPAAGVFVTLAIVSVYVCVRRRRASPWALVAAGVQTATLVHALFDVYWVRSLPTLGWLLVGLAMLGKSDDEAQGSGGPRQDVPVERPQRSHMSLE